MGIDEMKLGDAVDVDKVGNIRDAFDWETVWILMKKALCGVYEAWLMG